MHFHIVSIFPKLFAPYLSESILKRAAKKKLVRCSVYDPRGFADDPHRKVDDRPYGGGPGMVMKALPILKAVERAMRRKKKGGAVKVIVLSPRGKAFTNGYARRLATRYTDVVLIAGRYEGIDARVRKILKAEEVSVGPYTLTGGELPALTVIDAVSRYIPGVLGKVDSLEERRIAGKDVYTRPESFIYKKKAYRVPDVLRSGHHRHIDTWRLGGARAHG